MFAHNETGAMMVTVKNDNDQSPAVNHRRHVWLNWTLALLTVPGAALVMLLWFGAVMGSAGCSDVPCRHQGPDEFFFGVLVYGAPVVAVLTIGVTFFTATRRRGILVPLCGWALLAADVMLLVISFRP